MGMYTEIYVNVNLREDTPIEIIRTLDAMIEFEESELLYDKPERWRYLFSDGSFYTPSTCCGALKRQMGFWSFIGKGDIKNYDNEIEKFFAWIMPHVDASTGAFIGYKRYEEDILPTLIFKE